MSIPGIFMQIMPIICIGGGFVASKYIKGDLNSPEVSLQKAKAENIKAKVKEETLKMAPKEAIVYVVEKEASTCTCQSTGVEVK